MGFGRLYIYCLLDKWFVITFIYLSKPFKFDLTDQYIRFCPSAHQSKGGLIEYRFPNVWMLSIIPEKFVQMMAFVPIDENLTRLYLRSYQTFVTIKGFASILNAIFLWQSKYIFNQDKNVVLSQNPKSSFDADHELLLPSDTAIRFFRERWRYQEKCDWKLLPEHVEVR